MMWYYNNSQFLKQLWRVLKLYALLSEHRFCFTLALRIGKYVE